MPELHYESWKGQCKTTLLPYHHYLPITCTQERFCHCLKPVAEHGVVFSLSRAGAAEQTEAWSTGKTLQLALLEADLQPG